MIMPLTTGDEQRDHQVQIALRLITMISDYGRELGLVGANDQFRLQPPQSNGIAMVDFAKKMLADRRRRTELFDSSFFGEAAWDILLDLFVSKHSKQLVNVSSACIAADVPATTALRWIDVLLRQGMIHKVDNPNDNRQTYLAITDMAETKVNQYLQASAKRWGYTFEYSDQV